MAGFIKLSRKFFSNDMWNEARTFSSCEAWLDLIQSARFEATPRKESIGGREVSYMRGQYPASIRFLAKRWIWTERKVRSFLSYLKKEKMITLESSQGISIITLCKFDEYNSVDTPNDTRDDTAIQKEIRELRQLVTQLTTQQVTQPPEKRHTSDTNTKKEEEYIKETSTSVEDKKAEQAKKLAAAKAATLSRRKIFYDSLIPFVERYGSKIIREFYNYWSELDRSETKMRFEKQTTWEVGKRLTTWANREKFDGKRNSNTGLGVSNKRASSTDKAASRNALEEMADRVLEQYKSEDGA